MRRIRTLLSTEIASELVLTVNHIPRPTSCTLNSKFGRAFPFALFGPDKPNAEAEDSALRLQDLPRLRAGFYLDSYSNSLVRILLQNLEQAAELYRSGGLITTHGTDWHSTIVDGAGRFHLNIN